MWYQDETEFKEQSGYEVNGKWYPRVTKILEIKSKPALENFFREVGHYEHVENYKNKSAEEGTMVHEAVQKLLIGEPIIIAPEIQPAVSSFQKFNETRKIFFHPEFVEKRIWSSRHRYAGTVDALATIDGKFGVLDIKTSTGFYPEYNLQTAAYISALQEYDVKRSISIPQDLTTRWILRIDQISVCERCGATRREKGGRVKIRENKKKGAACDEALHQWGEVKGDVDLKEFPNFYGDMRAFVAAKILWEWENGYWLRKIGYI